MKSFRMPVLGAMGVVLASALAFAAIRRPSALVASLTFTVALTILLNAILAAWVARRRTFWRGFVIFGWGYLLLAFAPWATVEVRPYLLTTHILDDLSYRLGLQTPDDLLRASRGQFISESGLSRWIELADNGQHFQRIGHSLAAVLHGVMGGVLAIALSNWRRTDDAPKIADGHIPADLKPEEQG